MPDQRADRTAGNRFGASRACVVAVNLRGVPAIVGFAVIVLLSIVLWGVQRGYRPHAGIAVADDRIVGMLIWLLVLAAFIVGAFVSYVLVRP
jgi:hypothetical protein